MKTITITCDLCHEQMRYEGIPLTLDGVSNSHPIKYIIVQHCCDDCKQLLVLKINDFIKGLSKGY